jgi:ApaG protein
MWCRKPKKIISINTCRAAYWQPLVFSLAAGLVPIYTAREHPLGEIGPVTDLYNIEVSVETTYVAEHSEPEEDRFVFAYTITLVNRGSVSAQLLSRHWVITDADSQVEEVRGDGVVGEQPVLKPGEGFRYTSGAVIETPVGTMQGSYQMVAEDGQQFDATIPEFVLSAPRTLH